MARYTLEALEWPVLRACLSECGKVCAAIRGVLVQGAPQEQLALSLLVMLAQQRRYISVQTQTGPLKLITELLDRAQESLHLVSRSSEFLNAASGCSLLKQDRCKLAMESGRECCAIKACLAAECVCYHPAVDQNGVPCSMWSS